VGGSECSRYEKEQIYDALIYREKLLNTVNKAAEVLLTANEEDTMTALMSGMEIVGHCVEADRVQIWRNEVIDGELYFVMRYEWLSEVGKQKIEVPIGLKFPYSGLPEWLDMFYQGKAINSPISKLPLRDASFLGYYQMVSIVCLPLFLNQEFIGFFSVDDCRYEKIYTNDEMNMFASVGLMFTSVFNRVEQANIQRENKKFTEALYDSSPLFIDIWDENLDIIDCNDKVCGLLGIPDKWEYLNNLTKYNPPTQPCGTPSTEYYAKKTKTAFENGFLKYDWTLIDANGEEVPVEVTAIRIMRQGKPALVGYNYDLRQRKMLEEQTREREAYEMTSMLLENSPALVEIWDSELNFVDCNQRLLDIFGVSSKEEYLRRYNDFIPKYQPCGTLSGVKGIEYIKKVLVEGSLRYEWMRQTSDGKQLPVEVIAFRMERGGRKIIVSYNNDLRSIKAAIESEESNRAKSRFLARMSHEIRTPITAVMGISEVHLRGQVMPPHLEEAFSKIYDSSKILLNIVNDILDFSKIESGKMTLLEKEYDVASLAGDVSQLHLVYLDNKDILFQMHVDKNLPAKLVGDSLRIRQIINNLLTNAFKYTESGLVALSLQKIESDKDGYIMLVISIEDTGMGMSAQQIEEVQGYKGEYIRLHEHEKPFVSGTGLGLHIVYSMVQMMNAEYDMQSDVGKGTHVTVKIPQKVVSTEILGDELATKLQNFESGTWTAAKEFEFIPEQMPYGSVLVVDDVEANLYVAEAMLKSFGLNIDLAENGQSAVDKIARGRVYDIIFLDHMMPGMDGVEVANILRDMGYNHPIVALTANAIKGQAEMFMNNGFSGFMSKPIDIKILNSYLVRFIKK